MIEKVLVPDVGEADNVEVVELLVNVGDVVAVDDSIVVLESDKASMEIPSPVAGKVVAIAVAEGEEVEEGSLLLEIEPSAEQEPSAQEEPSADKEPSAEARPSTERPVGRSAVDEQVSSQNDDSKELPVYAGPAVRKQAREYGVNVSTVKGSGRKGRILKEDIQAYVKTRLSEPATGSVSAGIPPVPEVDFSRFGTVELAPLSRIRQASARNLHRSWLNVPHVTQFDEADVTELEAFRHQQNGELADGGIKLTPLAFLICGVVAALKAYPQFNASLDKDQKNLVLKRYYHIGIAVETDDGLVVPVLKDADKKGVVELAAESAALAAQARARQLPMDAMQGASFTISSLGSIGGTAFTPIVNSPEVAILGVSRAKVVPIYDGEGFVPRTMLPLSLSYDHRAIDGAEAARFTSHLARILQDIRRTIL